MIMEFLALVVPPLIIVFALAMEAVEDRLLRREQRRAGPVHGRTNRVIQRRAEREPSSRGTTSPASPASGTGADRRQRRRPRQRNARHSRPHPDRARPARQAAGRVVGVSRP
jgi:hypothetical protein